MDLLNRIFRSLSSTGPHPFKKTPFLLAFSVFILSLLATYGLTQNAYQQAEEKLRAEFDFQVRETAKSIAERMATYEQVARGTQAFLLGSLDVTREDFRLFVQSLRLQEKFPGIQGIAFVQVVKKEELASHIKRVREEGFPSYTVHPMSERELYSSIIQIEPFTGLNVRAFGFDMLTNPVRRAAMERARDTGDAAASGKVTLIQENGKDPQSGLVMYLPAYKRGAPLQTVEERRANIIAWIGAPFRMNDLMKGLRSERSKELILSIYDGENPSEASQLYSSLHNSPRTNLHQSLFSSTTRIYVAGRPWTLDMRSSASYEKRIDTEKVQFIAIAGSGASILLAFLVWILASGRDRAVALASAMTQQLKESEFRWKYALEGAGDGVFDLNTETGNIIYSKRWKEMLGYSEFEIQNDLSEWESRVHPDDKQQARDTAAAYLSGSTETYSSEFRMRCKDGSWKWIHARAAPVSRRADGSVLRTIGTHTDITVRKEAEHLELERTRALNEARDSLRHAQKLEAVGKLTGGVAHDFNNVLQVLSGNIQMLEFELAGLGKAKERLASMLSAVEKGSKLSSQLLSFARRQPLQPVVLNLKDILQNMEDLLIRALGESVQLRVVAVEDLWNTFVDSSQLENVILNLVINARDAMPEGGSLTVSLNNATLDRGTIDSDGTSYTGDFVLLTIADTGTGMSKEVMEQAFEPFFTTKPAGEGTGLGLSMAYGFIKQTGGHIQISSKLGHGTKIDIYLPRSLQEQVPNIIQPIAEVLGGNETILVVEDDREVKTAVSNMLNILGYQIRTADNAQEALNILKSGDHVDLLFTDVVMPGTLSAPQLAKEAKKILPKLAILFTSGYTRNALVHGGRLEEGVQLLSKPYRQEQLAQKIRQVLSQTFNKASH